jgi:hypothetical protein
MHEMNQELETQCGFVIGQWNVSILIAAAMRCLQTLHPGYSVRVRDFSKGGGRARLASFIAERQSERGQAPLLQQR